MSDSYPYIQTLHSFDESMGAYAIQPVGEDDSAVLPEENPIMAFGPLGYINIFVGATNAGKSRFLRTLAKRGSYQFLTEEAYGQMTCLIVLAEWLSKTSDSFSLKVEQERNRNSTSSQPPALQYMAPWVKEAFQGLESKDNFEVTFDNNYFRLVQENILEFLVGRFNVLENQKTISELPIPNPEKGVWAKNLLVGEDRALIEDANIINSGYKSYESFASIQNRKERINVPAIDWKFINSLGEETSQDWKSNFIAFWEAYDFLRQTDPFMAVKPPQRIYIPTLRSAVSLSDENGQRLTYDIFEKTVRRNYKLDDTTLEIFTGNKLYETIHSDRNGTPDVVARLREFERFLGAAFYEGRSVEIVALDTKYDEGQHIDVRVQGETARQLHHLGDGINTLVILLYQLFMAQPSSWIFIEEPELNLHPGLQRVFLQTLLENEALQKRNLRVFLTTHSNHLLRMTLRDGTIAAKDISVFAFQQRQTDKDRFLIRPLLSEHHDALALLGVQNASVLLAQCGVWVEGPTDRQYVRAYLSAYQESQEFETAKLRAMREDTHFAFWEYAGSNLAHYLMSGVPKTGTLEGDDYEQGKKALLAQIQTSALCNRIFLLSDRDETKAAKHVDLENLAQGRTNFTYFVTDCVEIENLLSPTELAAVLPQFLKGKPPAIPVWKQSNYKSKRMGTFLKSQFAPAYFPVSWRAKSGTLATERKNRLCELAMADGIITWSAMSEEAQALAKALYEFVARHNSI